MTGKSFLSLFGTRKKAPKQPKTKPVTNTVAREDKQKSRSAKPNKPPIAESQNIQPIHLPSLNDTQGFKAQEAVVMDTQQTDWSDELDRAMPKPSGRGEHLQRIRQIESKLNQWINRCFPEVEAVAKKWTRYPSADPLYDGITLLSIPISNSQGDLFAAFHLRATWDAYRIRVHELWASKVDGEFRFTWKDFKRQQMDYGVVVSQILHCFEATESLQLDMTPVAETIFDQIKAEMTISSATEEIETRLQQIRAHLGLNFSTGNDANKIGAATPILAETNTNTTISKILLEARTTAAKLEEQGKIPEIFANSRDGEAIMGWKLDEGSPFQYGRWYTQFKVLTNAGELYHWRVASDDNRVSELLEISDKELRKSKESSLRVLLALLKQLRETSTVEGQVSSLIRHASRPENLVDSDDNESEKDDWDTDDESEEGEDFYEEVRMPSLPSSSPANPEQKFWTQVQDTLNHLNNRGVKPHLIKDDQGNSVTGWLFETEKDWRDDKSVNTSNSTTGAFEETWGERKTIFTVDGKFYTHSIYNYDKSYGRGGEVEEYRSNRLTEWPAEWLAGNKSEPFSEIIAKLKRFSYNAYSLA